MRYFEHVFPFDKQDLVLLPEFPYGGMEHAGAVFLREEAMLFRAPPTAADRLRRAKTRATRLLNLEKKFSLDDNE